MSGALFDSLYGGLQKVLDLRTQQHTLTATNLANADTPNFKAKVINFQDILHTAMARSNSVAMHQDDTRHLSGRRGSTEHPRIEELEAPPWAENGNSVLPEREMARLSENSLLFGAVSRGLSNRLKILRFAASDGK